MIVYEFYLREEFTPQPFEVLCSGFYEIGPAIRRKVDGQDSSAVYSISRNPRTHWVQLMVDDNAPAALITAIEARINGLADGSFAKFTSKVDNVAPMERLREEIGI